MKKRILSIAVCLCMVISLLPVTALAVDSYDIYVVGVQITSANASDITGNGNVSYDVDSNTLTLNNATISGTENGIYSGTDLKIELIGTENSITSSKHGIVTEGSLEIFGDGDDRLEVHSGRNGIFAYNIYMLYNEELTIDGVTLVVEADGEAGIVASKSLAITDSQITASGTNYGLQGGHFDNGYESVIKISNSTIRAEATGGEAKAFEAAPVNSVVTKWRSSSNGEWTESSTPDFTQKYLELEFGTATQVQAPVITAQPVSATYAKGAAATALTVEADVTDGGTLSYQWYSSSDANTSGTAIGGANSASYIPSTSDIGTTYYYCVVTNTKNDTTATATSDYAAIIVNSSDEGTIMASVSGTFASVPNVLQSTAFSAASVDELKGKMIAKLKDEIGVSDTTGEASAIHDVNLMVVSGGSSVYATETDFINAGRRVTANIPIPSGTDKATHDFYVIHVFTTTWGGKNIGDYEWFVIDPNNSGNVADCVRVELAGCSPVAVYALPKGAGGVGGASGSGITLYGPYSYGADENVMYTETESDEAFEYGEPVYYLIYDETEGDVLSDHAFVEKLKAKVDWNMNGDIVESVQVIKRYADVDNSTAAGAADCRGHLPESGYYYFLEIMIADKETTSETDVAGVVEFNRKKNSKKNVGQIKDCEIELDFTVFYPNNYNSDGSIVSDRADLEWDTEYALKFDCDDEVELSFGSPSGGNNEGTFTVDVSGQGKLYLVYTTDPIAAIEAANPDADMDFLIFKGIGDAGVRFNRAGQFVYEMENGGYAYKIVDGKLVEIADCYSASAEEFSFTTNTLGAYVFSDRALNQPA